MQMNAPTIIAEILMTVERIGHATVRVRQRCGALRVGQCEGPSVHRRRLMTAAYPRSRRGINIGVETATRAAAGCLGSTEEQNDKTVDAAGAVDAQTAPAGPWETANGFPRGRRPSLPVE